MKRHMKSAELFHPRAAWMWLVMLSFIYAAFFVFRYGGLWIENDTGVFSRQAAEFMRHGSIFYPGLYNHGYVYTAWLGGLSLITGLQSMTLNTIVMPFFGLLLLVISSYLAFSALLPSRRVAALAVIILTSISGVAFSALRGTHEKLSMAFVCLAIYCIVRAFEAYAAHRRGAFIGWLAIYFFIQFLNAGTNDFFAATFLGVLTFTCFSGAVGLLSRKLMDDPRLPRMLGVMGLIVAGSWAILIGVMLFVFHPEARDMQLVNSVVAHLKKLFQTSRVSSHPYQAAASIWANGVVYELMDASRWLVVIVSASVWIHNIYRWVIKGSRQSLRHLFLIAIYTAYALIVCLSIPVDFTGLAAGNNLEVRNFTYASLMGVPLVAEGIYQVLQTRASRSAPGFRVKLLKSLRSAVIGSLVLLSGLGLLKVTLDPLVSNSWIYYKPGEAQALQFFWGHNRNQVLWTGPDDRLAFYAHAAFVTNPGKNQIIGYAPTPFTQDYLDSPVVKASALALHYPLIHYQTYDLIYDNGGAEIVRRVPKSPFMH